MDDLFTLVIHVDNVKSHRDYAPSEAKFEINTTLDHSIRDLKVNIWNKTNNENLHPSRTTITHKDRSCDDNDNLSNVLGTLIVDTKILIDDFKIIIDSKNTKEVIFDIQYFFKDKVYDYKCTLSTKVKVSKISLMKDANIKNELRIFYKGDEIINDELTLSEVLGLAKPGSVTIKFEAEELTSSLERYRYHVVIESNEPSLQEGNNIFEIFYITTLIELKQQIIERLDYNSVSRTFRDQIKLFHNGNPLIHDTHSICKIIKMNDEILRANNNIVKLTLEVEPYKSPSLSLFCAQFLKDVKANDRFEFMSNDNHVLSIDGGNGRGGIADGSGVDSGNGNVVESQCENGIESRNSIGKEMEEYGIPSELSSVIGTRELDLTEPRNKSSNKYRATGITFESFINETGKKKLIDQSMTSTKLYQFNYGGKVITLNTSQCIINKQDNGQSYVMINPSGLNKLNENFKKSDDSRVLGSFEIVRGESNNNSIEAEIVENEEPLILRNRFGNTTNNVINRANNIVDVRNDNTNIHNENLEQPTPTQPPIEINENLVEERNQNERLDREAHIIIVSRLGLFIVDNIVMIAIKTLQLGLVMIMLGLDKTIMSIPITTLEILLLTISMTIPLIYATDISRVTDLLIAELPKTRFVQFTEDVGKMPLYIQSKILQMMNRIYESTFGAGPRLRNYEFEYILNLLNFPNRSRVQNVIFLTKWSAENLLSNSIFLLSSFIPFLHNKMMDSLKKHDEEEFEAMLELARELSELVAHENENNINEVSNDNDEVNESNVNNEDNNDDYSNLNDFDNLVKTIERTENENEKYDTVMTYLINLYKEVA